jgi:hypothetical protein
MIEARRFSWIPFLFVLPLLLCTGVKNVQAQCSSLYTFTGEAVGDDFGMSVSDAGDVDNDGYDDLIVGAPENDAGGIWAGRAYVYSGQTGALLWTFTGEAAYDKFGGSVSGAGDVDADGYADLIVGAWQNDAAGNYAGRAYVYSGRTGGLLWTFTGEASSDYFGHFVSGAGDVDNDGYADLIVGAYGNDEAGDYAGKVYVYSGQTGAVLLTFTGEAAGDRFGYSVSGAGDVDNDGYADLIVGAPFNDAGGDRNGRAYVYSGRTGTLLWTFTGESIVAGFGWSVSEAGDVDADGNVDLIVGASLNDAGGTDAGRAYVYSGATGAVLLTFTGEAAGDRFGSSVSGAGDFDADGYADLIVGAYANAAGGNYAGRAYVYSGLTGALCGILTGEVVNEYLGLSVSSAGDINLDGYTDLIVGAYGSSVGGLYHGAAYVFTCLPGSIAGRVTADCPTPDVGLLGVTVDVFTVGSGDLVGTAVTDIDGNYQIDDLAPGDYTVSIVIPLGYNAATDEILVTVASGDIATADVELECVDIVANPRTSGFWKHQFSVAISGIGNAEYDTATLCGYLDLIYYRFSLNQVNQVDIYAPPIPIPPDTISSCMSNLSEAQYLLNVNGSASIRDQAQQQLMTLLLNVASGKVGLGEPVSADSATVSQAITYGDNLIDDPQGDYQTAWEICRRINTGQPVAAGVIPLNTMEIAYKASAVPDRFNLNQNYPNPFNAGTVITYTLSQDGEVKLDVYNILGRLVTSLVNGFQSAGMQNANWDGTDLSGRPVASGIYFYRLAAGNAVESRKMTLMK